MSLTGYHKMLNTQVLGKVVTAYIKTQFDSRLDTLSERMQSYVYQQSPWATSSPH
jgi:hypothetical protein